MTGWKGLRVQVEREQNQPLNIQSFWPVSIQSFVRLVISRSALWVTSTTFSLLINIIDKKRKRDKWIAKFFINEMNVHYPRSILSQKIHYLCFFFHQAISFIMLFDIGKLKWEKDSLFKKKCWEKILESKFIWTWQKPSVLLLLVRLHLVDTMSFSPKIFCRKNPRGILISPGPGKKRHPNISSYYFFF